MVSHQRAIETGRAPRVLLERIALVGCLARRRRRRAAKRRVHADPGARTLTRVADKAPGHARVVAADQTACAAVLRREVRRAARAATRLSRHRQRLRGAIRGAGGRRRLGRGPLIDRVRALHGVRAGNKEERKPRKRARNEGKHARDVTQNGRHAIQTPRNVQSIPVQYPSRILARPQSGARSAASRLDGRLRTSFPSSFNSCHAHNPDPGSQRASFQPAPATHAYAPPRCACVGGDGRDVIAADAGLGSPPALRRRPCPSYGRSHACS